jgi:hypothetical protein
MVEENNNLISIVAAVATRPCPCASDVRPSVHTISGEILRSNDFAAQPPPGKGTGGWITVWWLSGGARALILAFSYSIPPLHSARLFMHDSLSGRLINELLYLHIKQSNHSLQ